MSSRYARIGILASMLIVTAVYPVLSDYSEGIDTTGESGYCHDSLFGIVNGFIVAGTGSKLTAYHNFNHYFCYAFDDVKKAPDTMEASGLFLRMNVCYVIWKKTGNIFFKISVTEKVSNGRYVYRYGRNTAPGRLLLIKENYDKTIVYKPQNLRFTCTYVIPATLARLSWEPPLPNKNQLLGYICYFSKTSKIDTTKPVDMTQWDSVAYTASTELNVQFTGKYFNLVASYKEGKSDFLKGWTRQPMLMGTLRPMPSNGKNTGGGNPVKKTSAGYIFDFGNYPANAVPQSAILISPSGRRVATSADISTGQRVFMLASKNYPYGMYLVNVRFPDGSNAAERIVLMP